MAEDFHKRVASKLAEFQTFLDAEFQYAIARSRESAEPSNASTIFNLDELIREQYPKNGVDQENTSHAIEGLAKHDVAAIMPPVEAPSSMPPVDASFESAQGTQPARAAPASQPKDGTFGKSQSLDLELKKNCLKRFVTSMRFDYISAFLIISNAAFIGVQVEFLYTTATPLPVKIVDWVFCVCFLVELTLRLYARGLRGFFFVHDPGWNRFDFFIVITSTIDTVISIAFDGQKGPLGSVSLLRIARIIRITRVLRIIRVMKFFKDIRVMIAAIASTLKTVFWAMLLLVISMYSFSIAIGQMVVEYVNTMSAEGHPIDDDLLKYFGSIGSTIFTLFMTVSGGMDWQDASEPLFSTTPAFVVYIFFITFSTFCMLNTVTGIFCQKAIETYEKDKDNVIECQLAEKERFVSTLTDMFTEWDTTGDGICSKHEFELHINDEKMKMLLSTLDIETRDAMALYAMMDRDDDGLLNLDEFIDGCITLRGGAKAIHMERALVDGKVTMIKLDRILQRLEKLTGEIGSQI